ncbi:MAG TPA: ATP-binding protein [Nocardioidaceae bacterium]|jgi:anti-sigma regulatory factor (Ser/Thr protein kinase)|nr:ATP-binding protein [Nocardioidaceae bacterium]
MNGGNTEPQVADAQMPGRPDSASAGRAFLERLLDGWGVADEVIDDAALLTTELMANAVRQGTAIVNLRVELEDGLLHVDVQDDAEELPSTRLADPSGPGGLGGGGLWIVQSVARDWGSDGADGGKTVWFELKTV